ncbi:hypothetical protein [Pedobacter flavus]|uniref:Uncharacterized protein n=1 Tax=Pedobacter flavus TaxID=3113906 RepID=A0ABU7H2A0_9SPHI|nr:hypothetical protein [Pedobacter sp. VNH31]MEE1885389.1 hypothetical protein [Pedobacter sp. VNH31]
MTTSQNSSPTCKPFNSAASFMIIGAIINLCLVLLFISGVDNPNPLWGQFWFIRPIIVITLAGAMAGFVVFKISSLWIPGSWKLVVGLFLSLLIYVFILWMSSVLGFAGTLWN